MNDIFEVKSFEEVLGIPEVPIEEAPAAPEEPIEEYADDLDVSDEDANMTGPALDRPDHDDDEDADISDDDFEDFSELNKDL